MKVLPAFYQNIINGLTEIVEHQNLSKKILKRFKQRILTINKSHSEKNSYTIYYY